MHAIKCYHINAFLTLCSYSLSQVASVILVTGGVILTTLSASKPKSAKASQLPTTSSSSSDHMKTYALGICILTLALILSGFLGMVQDKTFAMYTRHTLQTPHVQKAKFSDEQGQPPAWQESMFYLHLLSMPMFYFLRDDLASQFAALSASPTTQFVVSSPLQLQPVKMLALDLGFGPQNESRWSHGHVASLSLPSSYIPLILNTLTQIVCVSGVHRLTSRVSSLTVTLVLVVRKAVSLLISVLAFGSRDAEHEKQTMMWTGAALVFVGTVCYSLGGSPPKAGAKEKKE
jgi:solute carrier family 35 (UDP-xylose/UDP-N-acetylglucosamine transporter), member B4